jgi:hypothetical protein
MNGFVIAVGAVVWLVVLVLCIGLAQAAASGERMLRRQLVPIERERPIRRAA